MMVAIRCGYSGDIAGPVTVPFDRTEFLIGATAGVIALALGLLLAAGWRSHRPLPVGGLLLGVAAVAGLSRAETLCPGVVLPRGLVAGLMALAVAGCVVTALRVHPFVASPLAVPGAYLIATQGELVDVRWIRIFVGAAVVIGGGLVADFDRRFRRSALAPVLVAVSAVGVFYTVPDTEEAMVLVGAALPIGLLGWPLPLASLGTAGSFVATGLLSWTVAAGGWGRQSSIVGGVACLGLLVVEPGGRLLRRAFGARVSPLVPRRSAWWGFPVVIGVHLGLVYVPSRVAGLQATVARAVAIALGAGVLGVATMACLGDRPVAALALRRREAGQAGAAGEE